jgi:hypothetical protein
MARETESVRACVCVCVCVCVRARAGVGVTACLRLCARARVRVYITLRMQARRSADTSPCRTTPQSPSRVSHSRTVSPSPTRPGPPANKARARVLARVCARPCESPTRSLSASPVLSSHSAPSHRACESRPDVGVSDRTVCGRRRVELQTGSKRLTLVDNSRWHCVATPRTARTPRCNALQHEHGATQHARL